MSAIATVLLNWPSRDRHGTNDIHRIIAVQFYGHRIWKSSMYLGF
jgi:hypothetical protein